MTVLWSLTVQFAFTMRYMMHMYVQPAIQRRIYTEGTANVIWGNIVLAILLTCVGAVLLCCCVRVIDTRYPSAVRALDINGTVVWFCQSFHLERVLVHVSG
jgi:hypothetical protein